MFHYTTNDAAKTLTASASHHQLNETERLVYGTKLSTSSAVCMWLLWCADTDADAVAVAFDCIRAYKIQKKTCVTFVLLSHSITN